MSAETSDAVTPGGLYRHHPAKFYVCKILYVHTVMIHPYFILQESDMSETQVTLGVWDEEKHNSWYLKDGHKRVNQM